MAWLSVTNHQTTDTPVLATVLNNIGLDIRTWGGNVDAAGYNLSNVGTVNAGVLNVVAATSVPVRLTAQGNTSNNCQIRIKGGLHATDLWAFGTDIAAGSGSKDFHFYSIANGTALTIREASRVVNIAVAPTFASNAAAIAGGLVAGDIYTDGAGNVKRVY